MAASTSANAEDRIERALRAISKDTRTKPVSVSLPAPLAELMKSLADTGHIESVSAEVTDQLLRRCRGILMRARLDELYDERPGTRPDQAEVEALAARLGVELNP